MYHNQLKLFLAGTAGAFSLISCSDDEVVTTNPGRPIEFHLEMQSRASDKTIANLDTIWVYADDGAETVFEATPFIKDQYGNFKSEEKIYWPDGKENINFTAFWPSPERLNTDRDKLTNCGGSNYDESTHMHVNLTPGICTITNETSRNVHYHYDLVTASTTITRAESNKGISLSFSHAYAQIEFRAKIDDSAEHKVVVHSMSVINFRVAGIYSINEKTWNTNYRSSTRIPFYTAPAAPFTVTSKPTSLTSKTGPLYVIPHVWNMATWGDGSESGNKSYLHVFAKVYRDGKLILPDDNWTEEEKNKRLPEKLSIEDFSKILNNDGCVLLRIPLGEDINLVAGNRYIITLDFTHGIGYFGKGDPTYPDQPILPNPLSMVDVTVADWSSSEIDVEP